MDDKTLVERAVAVPLLERLHRVPPDARLEYEHDPCHHSLFPIGFLCKEAADTIEALQSRIEALEAALRFYARENSWKSCGVYMSGQSQPSSAEVDRGNKARKALESQP